MSNSPGAFELTKLPPLTAPDEVRGAGTSCFPSAFSLRPSASSGTLSGAGHYGGETPRAELTFRRAWTAFAADWVETTS
jgi:hypothetical protein